LTYESKFNTPIIMYGRLYFNLPLSTSAGAGGTVCIDLRTGQQVWWANNTIISLGQEFDYQSPNQFGTIPYLWQTGATYNCYDPWTGQWLFSLGNASTGTATYGPNGELLVYILNGANNWLAMWNSTKAIMYYQQPGILAGGNVWQWRPLMQRTMDWRQGLQWNVTTLSYKDPANQAISKVTPDVILATAGGGNTLPQNWQMEIGYSTLDGHQIWVQNRTTPLGSTIWALMGPAANGVYTEFYESTTQWQGFSLTTGQKLWGPTNPYPLATAPFGMYSWQASIAYGMLLAIDFGGYIHAYDIQTGTHIWDWFAGNSGLNTAYGAWPLNNPPPVSADGKIYISAGHGYNPPLFKGAKMYCVNATDGTLLWSLLGFHTYNGILVADGYLVAYNSYDAQVYCYGKGQTATTVSASPITLANGGTTTIQGTVTDQSPGKTCLGIPAAGTPAISDASMSPWMEYLYEQQPKPTNATGVKVTLSTFDPNNNTYVIGTTTSDANGLYKIMWTPPVPGAYTIIATFAGSDSYYGSSAETAIGVTNAPTAQVPIAIPAPTATPPPTVTTTPSPSPQVTETPIPPPSNAGVPTTYIIIAVVAIIIVVAAAALALRRRK
jgi:outer membrane protein assembly factor BamB